MLTLSRSLRVFGSSLFGTLSLGPVVQRPEDANANTEHGRRPNTHPEAREFAIVAFGWIDVIGIVGLVTLLAGFLGNLAGRVPATSVLYGLLNMVGSSILAVYAYLLSSWVFLPLEIIWAVAAGVSLARRRPSRLAS